jgi:hypothetical protein
MGGEDSNISVLKRASGVAIRRKSWPQDVGRAEHLNAARTKYLEAFSK